ncbi:MAG: FRG domain-containing protein [Bacteroidia bacterium]|jgi:hypothetical protein|nr:FRG domain-containing protein [Saprospiraceae bacterium]MBV6474145.1 hypothetical protein [Saprospiraceae bacterium]
MKFQHPKQLKDIYEGSRVHSISELMPIIETVQMVKNTGIEYFEFYRGHSLEAYKLLSGLSRLSDNPTIISQIDNELQSRFDSEFLPQKLQALELSQLHKDRSFELKWKLAFQAQHLGLKTRLLDWSINWRIALMFAVEDHFESDGALWIFLCPKVWRYSSAGNTNYFSIHPNNVESTLLINHGFLLDEQFKEHDGMMRVARQAGRFTIQSYNESIIPLEAQSNVDQFLIKIIIDGASKPSIKAELKKSEGIHLDWAYYRKDSEIDDILKIINTETISKYIP